MIVGDLPEDRKCVSQEVYSVWAAMIVFRIALIRAFGHRYNGGEFPFSGESSSRNRYVEDLCNRGSNT